MADQTSNTLETIEEADLGTLLRQRPVDSTQRVEFWINGDKLSYPVRSLVMRLNAKHPVTGAQLANIQIAYGWNPTIGVTGNDDITRREVGGVISAYFTVIDGQLKIGLLRQLRPCQDLTEKILNVVRGYLDPGKTRMAQALEEGKDEVGNTVTFFVVELPCDQANANNANVETWDSHGNSQFAFYVPPELLIPDGKGTYVFDKGTVKAIDKDAEKIMGMEFHPWKVAARVGDDFTRAILSPLLAWLDDIKVIAIAVSDFDPLAGKFFELRKQLPANTEMALKIVDQIGKSE